MKRLKQLRLQHELTLKQLSQEVGLRDSTLSQYETGKRFASLKQICKIADFFKISVDYLIGRSENMQKFKIQEKSDYVTLHLTPEAMQWLSEQTNMPMDESKFTPEAIKGFRDAQIIVDNYWLNHTK